MLVFPSDRQCNVKAITADDDLDIPEPALPTHCKCTHATCLADARVLQAMYFSTALPRETIERITCLPVSNFLKLAGPDRSVIPTMAEFHAVILESSLESPSQLQGTDGTDASQESRTQVRD